VGGTGSTRRGFKRSVSAPFGVASFSRHVPTRAGEARLAALIARVPGIPGIKDALTAIPFSFTAAQTNPRVISPCGHSNGDLHPLDKPRTVSNPSVSPLCSTLSTTALFSKPALGPSSVVRTLKSKLT